MRNLLRVIGNTALIVGGFFIVLFGTSKISSHSGNTLHNEIGGGIANADAPLSCGDSSGGCGGDCGSSDSGGGGK